MPVVAAEEPVAEGPAAEGPWPFSLSSLSSRNIALLLLLRVVAMLLPPVVLVESQLLTNRSMAGKDIWFGPPRGKEPNKERPVDTEVGAVEL